MRFAKLLLAAVLATASLSAVQPAFAQDDAPVVEAAASNKQLQQLWTDFLHYIRLARPDLARSYGQAILDSNPQPRDIYLLSVATSGSQATLGRGANLEGLGQIVESIRKLIEQGYLAERSDPQQIRNSIEMLGGTIRSYEIGKSRLQQSGEYALPQLIQKLSDPKTPGLLKERIITMLPSVGKDAVRGLSAVLAADDAELLEIIAGAIGEIKYRHASGALKELALRKDLPERTRQVAQAALVSVAGVEAIDKSPAEIFYSLALEYYYEAESVSADPRYETANVWHWRDGLGLTYVAVPREVFPDIYTMRMTRRALHHDGRFYPAVSLWLSANIRKATKLEAGFSDPTAIEGELTAADYALAASAQYLQDVLSRAIADKNSAVAISAIGALSRTAGARNLVAPVAGGAQPLVEALTYPDRKVRFLAALALAGALPDEKFNGYQLVTGILSDALRQAGRPKALLIAPQQQQRNEFQSNLRVAGYDVITADDVAAAVAAARAASGADLAVIGSDVAADDAVGVLRREALLARLPVILTHRNSLAEALAEKDSLVHVLADDQGLVQAVAALTDPEQAHQRQEWPVQAANAIRLLGLTSTNVFEISRACPALEAALTVDRSELQIAALKALAVMDDPQAQRAVAAQALSPQAQEFLRVAAFGSLSESMRRFGNLLTDEQAQQTIKTVLEASSPELRTAASQALGAMNLPSEQIKDLILKAPAK